MKTGTDQELFDFVLEQMSIQGKPSTEANGGCSYRGPGNLKCAAGFLLEDGDFHKSMENSAVCDILLFKKTYDAHQLCLIGDMQECHDEAAHYATDGGYKDGVYMRRIQKDLFMEDFLNRMKRVGVENELSVETLKGMR